MRVLVIDDDGSLRGVILTMLRSAGLAAEEADGLTALKALRRFAPDVVLCDLFMPERDGLELLRDLSRENPATRFVAMSGGAYGGMMDMLPVAQKMGAAAVLPKPFTLAELLAAVGRAAPEGGGQKEEGHG